MKVFAFNPSHWLCSTFLDILNTEPFEQDLLSSMFLSKCWSLHKVHPDTMNRIWNWLLSASSSINDFQLKKKCSFVEDFFLMGFCKALSCFCCDINPAVMSIWKSWRKIKPNKKSNKILIDLHVYLIVNVLNHNKYKHCWIINKFNHISFSFSSSLKFLFN